VLPDLDPRLRAAVDASIGWYEDLCALHGVGSRLDDGIWSSLEPPPPLHSDAVTVEPGVPADRLARRLAGREHAGVKDSFAELDLGALGMRELFTACWVHRPAPGPRVARPPRWAEVSTDDELAEWTALHDTTGVLLPGLLRRARFRVLGRREDGRLTAGAVARLGSGVVDVSNVWVDPGRQLDWQEVVDAVGSTFPDRAFVGYERGPALDAAMAAGFDTVGELRVWVR
jgi:hypothetical protein